MEILFSVITDVVVILFKVWVRNDVFHDQWDLPVVVAVAAVEVWGQDHFPWSTAQLIENGAR